MYERLSKCPICEKTSFTNFIICKDYSISKESFAISSCDNCSLKFTNPRPTIESIGKYYESQDYISHADNPNNLINFIYRIVRKFTIRSKYRIIYKYFEKPGKLLDYGCGTGTFLSYCKDQQWNVIGLEPNSQAKLIAEKDKILVYNSEEELHEDSSFDVITLWHVLEHVHDLSKTLTLLKSKLAKTGIICVAVPNVDAYDSQYYKEFWAAYDVPRHLYHFNQETFKKLIKKHKMKIIDIKPMKLDAFYVSMLSEKYKESKSNLMKAVLKGFESNNWAYKNNNNYSSLIYIIKK